MKINVNYSDLTLFNPVFYPVLASNKRYNVLRGGAGSGKSIQVIDIILMRILSRTQYNVLVARKFGVTLKKTVFKEFQNMIDKRGFTKLFKINKSDMTMTCLNGNIIYFTGLDTPEKIKSLESTIVDIWLEEVSDFNQEDFEQLDLRLRGINQYMYQMYLSFNPISQDHWLKKFFYDDVAPEIKSNLLTNFSTYKDNKFIDDKYREVMEAKKHTNPTYYDIYCLGNWGTTGKQVYTNWEVKDFNLDEKNFNLIYYGVDFGFNDPTAMVKIGYKDQEIYIMGEIYRQGLITNDLITLAKNQFPTIKDHWLFADSAEPDRISEIKKVLPRCQGANKAPNYKKAAIDFIKGKKIYVHPNCKEFITEIRNYCYKKSKTEERYYDEPQEFGDHLMDALIYSTDYIRNANKGTRF